MNKKKTNKDTSFLVPLGIVAIITLLVGIFFLKNTPNHLSQQLQTADSSHAASAIPATILNGLHEGGVSLVFGWYDIENLKLHEFDDDLAVIKSKGGGHVRLSISMATLENGTTGTVKSNIWTELKSFVNLAKANGIVTIIDNHNVEFYNSGGDWNEDYMGGIRNAGLRKRHTDLMTDLSSKVYRELDRNWVVLQPANEPIFTGGSEGPASTWYNYQPGLLTSMRGACPDCTIFAVGNGWEGVAETMEGLNFGTWYDNRMIIDLHMYAPLELSHCSYPGQANKCPGKVWPGNYSDYLPNGTEFSGLWNKTVLANSLNELWSWKASHNLELHFSEIGTTGDLADTPRAAYLSDVTSILREHNTGWSCWEWDKNFGIINHPKTIQACLGTTPLNSVPEPSSTNVPTAPPVNTPRPTSSSTVAPTPVRTPTPVPSRTPTPTSIPTPTPYGTPMVTPTPTPYVTPTGTPIPPEPPSGGIITGQLQISRPLTLSIINVGAGQSVTGTVEYKNISNTGVVIRDMAIAARPPGGTNDGGPFLDFNPYLRQSGAKTLPPGASITFTASRTFRSSDPTGNWYVFSTYYDGVKWYDAPASLNIALSVGGAQVPPPVDGSTLVVNAGGTRGGRAFPTFKVFYNGASLGEATVTSQSLRAYPFTISEVIDISKLKIVYDNDYFSWWGGDRNLRIDSVQVNGATYRTTDSTVYSVGAWTGRTCGKGGYYQTSWLACNGYFQF